MPNQVNLNDDGTIWNKTTPSGEPFIVGNSYYFKNNFWVYLGDFKSPLDVPNVHGCYTLGDEIHIRSSIKVVPMIKEKVKRRRVDDNRPIMTDIKDEDNQLMALAKTVLREKEVTRGDFKELYDNDSDMNNSLRSVESSGNLSWSRFTDICDRMGVSYEITLKDKDGNIIEDTSKSKPKKKKR